MSASSTSALSERALVATSDQSILLHVNYACSSRLTFCDVDTMSHILISYDHGHKELVYALNDALKKLGCTTWIDKDNLSECLIQCLIMIFLGRNSSMTMSIDNAAAIVVCYSERYEKSINSRKGALTHSQPMRNGESATELRKFFCVR